MTAMMPNSTTNISETASDFLRLVAAGHIREAFGKNIGASFRHHNPFFHGDTESLMAAMEENAAANPDMVLKIQHTLRDGNLVAVHSWIRQEPSDLGASVVHIFRFEGHLIAELWDV